MKDEERSFQPRNSILDAVCTRVLDKLSFDEKRAPGEIDVGLAVLLDLVEARSEVLQYVADISRRAYGGYGAHFRNVPGDGEDRCTTERVADQHRWRLIVLA